MQMAMQKPIGEGFLAAFVREYLDPESVSTRSSRLSAARSSVFNLSEDEFQVAEESSQLRGGASLVDLFGGCK